MAEAPIFVRRELSPALPPPERVGGAVYWVRRNLARTPLDAVMTVLAIVFLLWSLPKILDWTLVEAVWSGADRTVCTTVEQGGIRPNGWTGACWAFVTSGARQFMFGRYPDSALWRPIVMLVAFVALLAPILMPSVPRKALNALLLFVVFPLVSIVLLYGGLGFERIETSLWGGLLVTLILSFVGISVSLPLGILLALGRRSQLPVIRTLCVTFIEVVRGVPLITVLFMSSIMLPLFLPADTGFDKFLRALVGVSSFASAYMAEVIRGGLQAIPKGQSEGAESLGLSYWQKMGLVVMPQALKLVIPSIVNIFIGLFKDTSLVSIIGMFDLLGIVRQNFANPVWLTPVTPMTGLVFAGAIFWLFCFAMSRYSSFMEHHLDGDRRD